MHAFVRVMFAFGLYWIGSTSGLLSDVVIRCCELGRGWAAQSQSMCGPFPVDVTDRSLTGVGDVNEAVACIAAVDACCVVERRSMQCQAGRNAALTEMACHGLHLYQASEDAKECCNCCRLGAMLVTLGLPCHITSAPLLASSLQCVETFMFCCGGHLPPSAAVGGALGGGLGNSPGSLPLVPEGIMPLPVPGLNPVTYATPTAGRNAQLEMEEMGELMTARTTTTTTTTVSPFPGVCAEFEGQLCAHICIDTADSFRCACQEGFLLLSDGKSCQQIAPTEGASVDRCQQLGGHCEQLCIDTGREIHCNCRVGYLLNKDGRTCQDVDECIAGIHSCSPSQRCQNTPGSYNCLSHPPSSLSVPDAAAAGQPGLDARCPAGGIWNAARGQCDIPLLPLVTVAPASASACPPGAIWNSESRQCEVPLAVTIAPDGSDNHVMMVVDDNGDDGERVDDLDHQVPVCPLGTQLDRGSGLCVEVATASVSGGGGSQAALSGGRGGGGGALRQTPATRCADGYAWNRMTLQCEDIDECTIGTHTCDPTQFCENTGGYFSCYDDDPATDFESDADRSAELLPDVPLPLTTTTTTTTMEPPPATSRPSRERWTGSGSGRPFPVVGGRNASEAVVENQLRTTLSGAGHVTTTTRTPFNARCAEGYLYDAARRRCNDIDECQLDVHDCRLPNQVCVNTLGGFYCTCSTGFRFNAQSQFCEDVDECEATPGGGESTACGRDQTCENTLGSFICHCIAYGHELNVNTRTCVDIDECSRSSDVCPAGHTCQNTPGSYRCVGPTQLPPPAPAATAAVPGTTTTTTTTCQIGFVVHPATRQCVDIDECRQNVCRGPGSRCTNTPGSFTCRCEPGFELDQAGKQCTDIDECQRLCRGIGSRCVNTHGSFLCRCERGYQLDPTAQQCTDVNECQQNACRGPGSTCVNSPGSYTCRCEPGFELDHATQTCTDIDECRQDKCRSVGSRCSNTPGSFICRCEQGFELDHSSQDCVDIDECRQVCRGSGGRCINTVGSFVCRCETGYELESTSQECQDIDECRQNMCRGPGSRCANSPGSFTCHCEPGYELDHSSQTCTDVDECLDRRRTCSGELMTCQNTIGSFECGCQSGYELDSARQQCTDVDECRQQMHNCGLLRNCVNTPGSFDCVIKRCPLGYRLDYTTGICQPVLCPRGLRPDENGHCVDIDECAERSAASSPLCRPRQECVNNVGSFTCRNVVTCGPGFELNEDTGQCDDIDECLRGTHRCRGPEVQCINRPGTYLCQCPDGYQLNLEYQNCEDIDECQRFNGQVCSQSATCENTPGSFRCICRDGFQPDPASPTSCADMDECQQPRMCQHTCQNTWGSFHCLCDGGYELAADQRTCHDIDECAVYARRSSSPLCQGLCENLPGSYVCKCPHGYQMSSDSRTCRDVDECTRPSDVHCDGVDNVCVNTRGGYKCETVECPKGFIKSAPTAASTARNSIRCQRKSFTCPQGDVECLYAPLSYSANFITLPRSALRVPADLFTMRGPLAPRRRLQFELKLIAARDSRGPAGTPAGSPGGTAAARINESFFAVDQIQSNEAVVKLARDAGGPFDVELQLNMHVYSREFQSEEIFYGTAVARIFVYITDDPW